MQLISGQTDFIIDGTCAAAIGKFDGIHAGHQVLLKQILDCREKGLKAAVFTFDPSPNTFFSGTIHPELTTKEEKRRIFEKIGVDILIEYPLNERTAAMAPEQFIEEILVRQMHVELVVAGKDLSFGSRGRGNSDMLEQFGELYGFGTKIIDKIEIDGEEVSSSRIRAKVQSGSMEEVTKLIGFPYSITGTIIHGRHLGTKIGMPTVNLLPPADKLLPPNGVYLADISLEGQHYKGISNIGCKPTVSEEKITGVETYIYDFDRDIYGKEITVKLLKFVRPERKFNSVEELKRQMQADIAEGRKGL